MGIQKKKSKKKKDKWRKRQAKKRARRSQPKKKYAGRNKHHLIPTSRGGVYISFNKILINIEKHNRWHEVFGNLTLDEIIKLLTRIKRMRGL